MTITLDAPRTGSKKGSLLKKTLLVLLVGIGVLAVVVAMQPDDYRVTRTATIAAPPATVFAQVNDFHNWEAWSPWCKLDPASKTTFEGPAAGTGAAFGWSGNSKVGEGRMTITDSRPSELVQIRLDFTRPFKSTAGAEFAFMPQGDGQTAVTWSMSGKKAYVCKAMCLFTSMDKMVGGDFEKGLSQMKVVAEAAAKL